MFLENWYKALKAFNANNSKSNATETFTREDGTTATVSVVTALSTSSYAIIQLATQAADIPGLYYITTLDSQKYGGNNVTASYLGMGVIIGDGNTPPTLSDYKLAGNVIKTFTATTSISIAYGAGKVTIIGTYNITNTDSSPFTVKEIGLHTSWSSNPILLTREVLETPVTIAPGDTGVVTYKIEIS